MKGKQLLLVFIKEHKWSYIFGIFILLSTTLVNMTIPKILGEITDGLNSRNMLQEQVVKYVLLLLGVVFAVFVLKLIWRYLLIGNCRSLEVYLRDHLFKHMQTLPVSFYSNNRTGNLVAYAINDVQAVRMTFGFGSVNILDGIAATFISIFFMAGTINPVLTAMALAPVPVAVFVMVMIGRLIRDRFRKVQEAFAAISEKVQENISGIRVIKAFAQEKEEVDNFLKYSKRRVDTQMDLTRISALLGPCAQVCFGISFLLFIVYGSAQVIKGTITLGDYVAFNSYMMAIMGPVMNISRIIDVLQRGIASFRRLNEIFDTPAGIAQSEGEQDISGIYGGLEIRNLNFTYPGASRRALKNINIKLDSGKTLGILGKTGSGKTTLVNLLLRLYDVDDGHILIDGSDINSIPVDLLRESIGYVPQDNFLFSTTIRDNIEFFKNLYSDYEIEQAARISGVYDNIISFPEGFDTVVGERGVTLSGGQKQRISIARALVKKPSLFILDDSLSAVDTKTEEEILANIREHLKKRTGIIISHRVSTVKFADEIIVMDNGKIAERGSHEELLRLEGAYFSLYRAQNQQEAGA
ncbi:MAG: ABC transporter ATP-binding protein [Ruminiclostridium sp.]|nr:ABC transporter ATP-binding protein [Ruminiclostridium sp.]